MTFSLGSAVDLANGTLADVQDSMRSIQGTRHDRLMPRYEKAQKRLQEALSMEATSGKA